MPTVDALGKGKRATVEFRALGRDADVVGIDADVAVAPGRGLVLAMDPVGESAMRRDGAAFDVDIDVAGVVVPKIPYAMSPLTVMSASDVRITQKSAIDAGPDDERRLPMRSHPAFGPTAAAVPRHPTSAAGSGRAPGPPRSACSGAARARPRPGPPTPPVPLSAGPENGWLTNLRRTAMLFRCLALPHAPYGTLGRGGSVPEAL